MNKDNLKSICNQIGCLTNELKNRSELALNKYNKPPLVHKKQMKFHKSKKRNRWVFGGNRSGKSECGAVECVYMALGCHPFRQNKPSTIGWVVSLSTKVQKDVAQKKILHFLPKDRIVDIVMTQGKASSPENGVVDRIIVKNYFNNLSVIAFKSCEEGREKFQGASLDYVWFDEEPPKDIYDECKMRVVDTRGDIFGTMTPLKGLSFVYEEIYLNKFKDPEVYSIFFSWEDNPFLNKLELSRLSKTMSKEDLEKRKYGRFSGDKQGFVYPEFSEDNNVIEPFCVPKEWQVGLSIDPGLNNPLSCHWYCVDGDDNIYVIAEHYEAMKPVSYHAKKIKEISQRLDWAKESDGSIYALIDSASTQRTLSAIKSVAELFREEGISVNPKVNKNLFDGIVKVKELLKPEKNKPKLFVFSSCANLIREFKGYRWGDREVPVKKDDHALDELRYFVMNYFSRIKPSSKESLNEIQKDKRRLIRKLKSN